MHPTTILLAAVLTSGIGAIDAVAQDTGHQEHHPASVAEDDASNRASPTVAGDEEAAPPMREPGGMGPGMMMGRESGMAGAGMSEHRMEMMQQCMEMMKDEHSGRMAAMDGRPGGMMAPGSDDPVHAAFAAINRRMHQEMVIPAEDDPDTAFARAMIPHHQGAIDMARVVLGFGKDPELRKLAEEVIEAQEREVAFLQQWLAKQPKPKPQPEQQ